MTKWTTRISLFLTLVSSIYQSFQVFQRLQELTEVGQVFQGLNLSLFILLLLISAGSAAVLIWSFIGPGFISWMERILSSKGWYWGVGAIFALLLMESIQSLFYLQADLKDVYYPVVLLQNQDLLFWGALVSGQSLLAWLLIGWKERTYRFPPIRSFPFWLAIGYLTAGVIFLSGNMASLPTNAPLPFLHLFLVLLIVTGGWLLVRWLGRSAPRGLDFLKGDVLAALVLWGAAFLLWSNVPLQSNYFIGSPRPPEHKYIPTSDAIYYEIQSQRLLAGEGFAEDVQHSFYNYLLSGLHWLGGDHYLDIYPLQIAILALIPFVIYKLAGLLFSRLSGWMAALLVIVREYNALHLGDSITVSNVQELMTEPLATLGVAVFLYLSVLWMREQEKNLGKPVLIGAVIALTALVRVELLSLGFVFFLILVVRYWSQWRKWLLPTALLAAGLLLVLTPWLLRNYQQTGQLSIDKGVVITQTIQTFSRQPEEGSPVDENSPLQSLGGIVQRLALRIRNKAFSSLGQTLVYLPSNYFPLGGLDTFINIVPEKGRVFFFQEGLFSDFYLTRYIKSLPYWKVKWEGGLTPRSILPQLLVVGLISLGLQRACRKHKIVAALPLLTMGAHILVYSLVGFSGGRYIQVVDWITLLYLSIGLSVVINSMFQADPSATGKEKVPRHVPGSSGKWQGLGWAGLIFMLVFSMPVVEAVLPERYPDQVQLDQYQEVLEAGDLERYLGGGSGGECLLGEILYPGFYSAAESFLDDRAGRMPDPGIDQMVSYLIGSRNIWVSQPSGEPLDQLRHKEVVLVCGEIVRDSAQDLEKRLRPFFLADGIFLVGEP